VMLESVIREGGVILLGVRGAAVNRYRGGLKSLLVKHIKCALRSSY
jgi:hypothetical protein